MIADRYCEKVDGLWCCMSLEQYKKEGFVLGYANLIKLETNNDKNRYMYKTS